MLDREIQEDARRKAEKILKAADAECAAAEAGVASRVEDTRRIKEAEYAKRLDAYRDDAESTLPLEKERRLVSFIDASVNEALDAWFEDIGTARRLSLYSALLERYKPILSDKNIHVIFAGYSASEVRSCVEPIFGNEKIFSVAEAGAARSASTGFTDGILVETEDRSVACRATREELRAMLLSDKRQELAEALLGGRLPE